MTKTILSLTENPRVISVSIFKGGTGKTTTSVNLAAALARLDVRVLLIDLDQQASATRYLGVDPELVSPNLTQVFMNQVPAGLAIHETAFGFSLIPGHPSLAAVEEAMEPDKDEGLLKSLIEGIVGEWDYVILDSPPGKAMLAINGLVAATDVIIPLQAERPALDGADDILLYIRDIVLEKLNPGLNILGLLPTMVKRTTSHSLGVVQKARKIWGDQVFREEVPATIEFPRSFGNGIPLVCQDPELEGAKVYISLAKRIHEGSQTR